MGINPFLKLVKAILWRHPEDTIELKVFGWEIGTHLFRWDRLKNQKNFFWSLKN